MPSVLLIDDDRDFCRGLEIAFRRLAPGLGIFPFHYGDDALAHLGLCGTARPLPGLVLLDCRVPYGPGGFEILRAIRALPALAHVPVWMLSASERPADIEQAWHLGADRYEVKPTGDQWPRLVQRVLECRPWRRGLATSTQENCRGYVAPESGLTLATTESALPSAPPTSPAMQTGPNTSFLPLPGEAHVLVRLFEHFRDMARQSFDQVDLAINEACRRHRIPPAHARGHKKDSVTVRNRRKVIFELFDLGYSNAVVEENFSLCERQVERIRLDWQDRNDGLLSDGKN